ncbi:MAG: hypothetical protein P4L84_34560 [Isosphaeraceae bacterium]|nr:hypothetical protein [Isosphaeraceae bacterium]
MRLRAVGLPYLAALALGCGAAEPAIQHPGESPAQAAARVFTVAEGLEKEHKTKQAFAAYRQLARQFPDTPEGKQAADRIRRAQGQAAKKSRTLNTGARR